MRIRLKRVRFCNFMSFGNEWTSIDLDKHPTTLVVGKNGAGKSSAILDTISFALFGKSFRNINKPNIANSITRQPCIVELDFTANGHELKVRRGTRPNLFEIYKNDILITETANVRDYQEDFEKHILHINHKTFCQIVMLGSAIFTPFMSLPAHLRREIIEDLLDLKVFTTMNLLLKDKISSIEGELNKNQIERNVLQEKISLSEGHIQQLMDSNKQLIGEKRRIIDEVQSKIDENKGKITRYTEIINALSQKTLNFNSLTKKMNDVTKLNYQLQHKTQLLSKEINFFQDHTNCPTCNQEIDEVFKIKKISSKNKENSEILDAINKISEKMNEIQKQIDEITKIQTEIAENKSIISELENSISFYEENQRSITKEIRQLEEKKGEIDTSQLSKWKSDLDIVRQSLSNNSDNRMIMSVASTLLKDNGIKAKIIKTYVPVINQLIQKYLAALDFFIEFKLDEQFSETINSRYRDTFRYECFSQGEKARIDLALLFTFRTLAKLRGSVDINLVVMDEVLDSAIDYEGIENLLKLISGLTNGENVIIISHREGISADKFSRTLGFNKVKNFSHLAEQ